MPPPPDPQAGPIKMISHNVLRTAAEDGETALIKAKEMGISIVRIDMRWNHLYKDGDWIWNHPEPNTWTDLLEPALKWTKRHEMRTLINLLAFKAPSDSMVRLNDRWKHHSGWFRLNERKAALWAAWATGQGIDLGVPSPKDFTEALMGKLAAGQRQGDYDIKGFCILNEPNTRWPAEANWKKLRRGFQEIYNTADYCSDLCDWVKGYTGTALAHTKNVINLYPFMGHWKSDRWSQVARNPNLDFLGIDIYWDQWSGLMARGVPEAMGEVSRDVGKPWWLVETAGADGPGMFMKAPSCQKIREYSGQCVDNGAELLGYYRLWGDYEGIFGYGSAYNVFTDPGDNPAARTDGRGNRYWENIRDL